MGERNPKKTVKIGYQTIYASLAQESEISTSDCMEVCFVLSGNGIHRVWGQSAPCGEGEVYVVSENLPHGFFVCDGEETLTVRRIRFRVSDWFEGETAQEGNPHYCFGAFRDGSPLAYAKLTAKTAEECRRLTDCLEKETAEEKSGYTEAIRSYLSLLFITVARCVATTIRTPAASPKKEREITSSVLRFVEEKISDSDLTLESIAASLYLSPSTVSRTFRQYMGESFSDFIRNYRLARACRLLAETDEAVADVVRACGLKDVPSFYRLFSRYKGTTPNQYRLMQKQKEIPKKIQEERKNNMSILNEISENLQIGKAKIVKELVQKAIDEGFPAKTILEEGLLSGMNVVGERFKNNEIFIPEVLIAARALNMGTQILKPFFGEEGMEPIGRVCIGTVQGDMHDIGKNLVKMMMEGKQLEVIDLGTDVPAETFVKTAIEQNCQVICCSALLTTTMDVMAEVVKAAVAAGIRDKVKIMIGGAPVNADYCRAIGADVYTLDAASAADAAVEICLALKA